MDFNFDLLDNQLSNIKEEKDNLSTQEEWHKKRLGKLTASRFDDIMVSDRSGKGLGQAAIKYVYEKVAELLTNAPHTVTSQAMDWGTQMEAEAIAKYEEISGNSVLKCDFIGFGEFAGGTPDGLVGDKGIIEVKCPFNPANHVEAIITDSVPKQYIFQLQGNMMVTGREWCDFISYDPRVQEETLKLFIKRVERDEELIKAINDRIKIVSQLVQDLYNNLKPKSNH